MLYIVPTPIGNLGDITLRSIETLQAVDYILCEDTRVSSKLLNHLGIKAKLSAFHAHNEHHRLQSHIEALKNGQNIALISDAGTPGISDPGFLLVREAHKENIALTVLPGPTALIPALVASGIPCDKFFFEGFLPVKKGRKTRLEFLLSINSTVILYESPHKLLKTLEHIVEYFGGDRTICVTREISKIHEEVRTSSAENMLEEYKSRPKVKGEIVIVIAEKAKKNGI